MENIIPVTAVQSVALFFCTADSCSRSNNLWMNIAGCCSCGTEFVNQCFIVAYHGTQRARNQMQLVLNNKIRRSLLYPVFITEYFLRIRAERKHCELIHGTQQQCGGLFINRFIHNKQRQILGREVALMITTPESKTKPSPAQRNFPVTRKFPLILALLYRPHLCTTPRAFQHNKRIATFSTIQLFMMHKLNLCTFILFEDRKAEIEFYYSIMLDIENNTGKIQTIDNSKFFRILKSNFLLMLYNLVEACVVSGMLEIYESLKQSQSGYNELIEEIQSLWSKYKIGEIYKSSGTRSSYEKGVREIIAQVITDEPVFLNRAALEISGNLDARRIKNLCDKHCIRYVASDDDGCLKTVKEKRQNLAHGDESFGDCARDMTLSQLEHIKDEVIRFIGSILNGMKNYYDNKLYLREPEKKKKKASKC